MKQSTSHNWFDYEEIFKDIFSRRYYTNHGKLAQEFESKLESMFNIQNAVCVTNDSLAFIISLKVLAKKDSVILSSKSSKVLIQSIQWAGLKPILLDLENKETSISMIKEIVQNSADISLCILEDKYIQNDSLNILEYLSENNIIPIINLYDLNSFSSKNLKNIVYILSFAQGNIIDTLEGACIATNNDDYAEKFRNMRSSYGTRKRVNVPVTANGRFSEAQAALGIISINNMKNKKMAKLRK